MLHVFSNVFDRWSASPVEEMQGLLGEIMCSPFFCNHVISSPFDGVSSRRNLRKLFLHYGENAKFVKGTIRHIMMNFIPYFEESGTYWNVMVSSENRKHVSRSTMIKAKNIIMKERTWINRVAQRDSLSKSVQ